MAGRFRLFAVLALALTIGVVSLVSTAAGAKKHGKKVQILNLTTRTAQEAELDLGPTGFGVGNRFVFSDNVFRGDQQVGVLGGECTTTRIEPSPLPQGQEPTSSTVNCVASIQLPKASHAAGARDFQRQSGSSFAVAITGGTGAYCTAHGEARITESENENGPDQLRLKIIR